jgi:hypothetical protein
MSCCNTLTAKVGGRANHFTAGREHPDNVRIHLDTDFGGDTDDACALAMLLGWRGVELTGITTVADRGGQRAAYVKTCCDSLGARTFRWWRGQRFR